MTPSWDQVYSAAPNPTIPYNAKSSDVLEMLHKGYKVNNLPFFFQSV